MRLRVMCCPGLGAERGRLSTGRPATPTSCLSPLEAGTRIGIPHSDDQARSEVSHEAPADAVRTAPGFLDTEQAGIVSVSVVASGSRRHETAILGNTQIAAPLVKSSL